MAEDNVIVDGGSETALPVPPGFVAIEAPHIPGTGQHFFFLRPCAFCGRDPLFAFSSKGYSVECSQRFHGCPMNARTHRNKNLQTVVAFWNTRDGRIPLD